MTLRIKPVKKAAKGHNRFCGPAAISIITGLDTAQSAALLRRVNRRQSITGTSFGEVSRVLTKLGYTLISAAKVNPFDRKSNPTLAAWLRETTRLRGDALYLISAGRHWQVVQGRRFCCGKTGEIVSIRDEQVKRRARVTGVWQITAVAADLRKALARDALSELEPTPEAKVEASFRAKATRLARQHGIDIELCGAAAPIVWGPSFIEEEENDPYHGDHISQGWKDALEMVETYVDLKQRKPSLFC
jgi:signal recognition particle subunit SEC65